ncbi:MAG: DUF1501 domain-containing protein [Verrucomicrobiae bacterium]|nr:DUF1501 domain-containing protein [Verrucomicrobiae bacterium]
MNAPLNRRQFLATSMGAVSFLPALLHSAPLLSSSKQRAFILVWLDGGMSHIDTFDGKPEAPPNIRGPLGSIESSTGGVFVSEHLPKIGSLMNQCSLIRSITSPEGNHDRGSHYMLTGRRLTPLLSYPSFGSYLHLDGSGDDRVPPYIAIPDAHVYARQGFLPTSRAPFELGSAPGTPGFRVHNLQPPPQLERAMKLLKAVDQLDGFPRSESEAARDAALNQAGSLSLNPRLRELFDVSKEDAATQKAYGTGTIGPSCLLARRLIEGGVRTVLVRDKGWDHHTNIQSSLTTGFPPKLPALDKAISALHTDLARRGMLENVTVLVASEFGRTPRINPSGGRDHWSRASSALLFGAGIQQGTVVGTTDARGEEPIEHPVTPADVFYTVLSALGADTERTLTTPSRRPIRIVDEEAIAIREILTT